jgi:hypothetical protein
VQEREDDSGTRRHGPGQERIHPQQCTNYPLAAAEARCGTGLGLARPLCALFSTAPKAAAKLLACGLALPGGRSHLVSRAARTIGISLVRSVTVCSAATPHLRITNGM